MQIQPKPLGGAVVSTSVQDVATASSRDGTQGLTAKPNGTEKAAASNAAQAEANTRQQQLKDALSKLNDTVQKTQPQLEFSVDSDTDLHVVKLVDKDSGEVIRQFPSKEAIELAKSIDQYTGMLIKAKS